MRQRKFATATLALADVKETAKHLGVTINDMVLAISAGALRQLSLKYDGHADHPLLASVPVSFDFSPDRISGNRFSGVMMVVPIHLDDPLERVQAVHDAAVDAKEAHHLLGPELVSRWAAYFPPAPAERLFHWLADKDGQNKVLNIPISNVPGPREHGRVGGALVDRDLLRRPAHHRQRAEHHGVELRRPAQHLGVLRRRHPDGSP